MSSTQEIILEYVCPALGVVIANIMFAAPVRDLKAAIAKGELGTLNPTPWAFMLGNCVGWMIYGTLLKNVWILMGNGPGLLIAIWLNLGAIKLLYRGHYATDMRDTTERTLTASSLDLEQPAPVGGDMASIASDETKNTILVDELSATTPAPTGQENLLMLMCTVWVVFGTVLALADFMDLNSKVLMVGIVTNCILIVFYGAPLSTISQVLKDRHTASIHVPTMILNSLGSSFWCVYGIAISDYFIAGPNALGFVFGAVQIFLYMVFPRSPSAEGNTTDLEAKADLVLDFGTAERAEQVASSNLVQPHLQDVMEDYGTVAPSA
ncbi:unnamed protein product [Cylindrotheca closterium]|uniref:Sugar transporter SWEET1 n=1 Tax=Cylindrotheca closterium TaxID=2856 RepID=A0AAD2CWN1_9STRA|nr:unnamed protein product [Cylindrotheca closterium]